MQASFVTIDRTQTLIIQIYGSNYQLVFDGTHLFDSTCHITIKTFGS